ncbi:helix-turn-helix domain-containing protein [Streptomyces caniscabiei]|uniref:helix-turn-helix domain-containing protein n=1 Tax=Streptomyces caniscabiei TaxID=2746961 RepID=UPI0018725657|nr:helix-turn-helix domain-containing protein [Streptomyces caniscabiei]MBE4775632.1 helix-turn-helix domain-containing protein [Streptomyces caniscabiei]MDX2957037.1 helix-turn-helix domain-containing protein [Streptomyces caniscabiei]
MPTLYYLINEREQLRLRFLQPGHASRHGATRVAEVVVRPLREAPHTLGALSADTPFEPFEDGTLFLVTLDTPGPTPAHVRVLDHLIRLLDRRKAAGLVIGTPGHDLRTLPDATLAAANRLELPLLATSAETAAWDHVNEDLRLRRAQFAERQVAHLDGLLNRLPARLADPTAARRIADWLSVALDAEVLVSSARRGVLAAAPDSAPAGLAHAVITGAHGAHGAPNLYDAPSPHDGHGAPSGAMHTRIVSISPGAAATPGFPESEDEARLAIASHAPFDSAATALIQHAAKLLGLCDQARREHQARTQTPRAVRHAAFQLLMRGETVLAQVVYTGAAQALLDTDTARVFVVDTGPQEREATLSWCERALAEQAIVSPCPGKPKHILILDPVRESDRVETVLKEMIAARGGHLLGQSRPHPLAETAVGYLEALTAVGDAAGTPHRIRLGGSKTKFAPLLPRRAAKAWAAALMAPLLDDFPGRGDERKLLLETLPTALSFKHTEAAGGLGVHRNTVTQRLNRAGKILSLDLRGSANDRVLTLLALDILALPAPAPDPHTPDPPRPPDFAALMAAAAEDGGPTAWAEERLRPVRADQRDLVETLCVWLETNLSTRETARALGLSEATVRNHTRDAAGLLGMDFSTRMVGITDTDVVTVADIALALHVLLGRPALTQPPRP